MNIYIRADGNKDIATGHIMRCLSIAEACIRVCDSENVAASMNNRVNVTFLVSDEESKNLLFDRAESLNTNCIVLNSDYRDLVTDFNSQVYKDIDWTTVDALLVDSYKASDEYFVKLRAQMDEVLKNTGHKVKIAYMDDFYRKDLAVDMVVNYDAKAIEKRECYKAIPQKLLGFSYTPLRSMFEHVKVKKQKLDPDANVIKKILLTAGGAYINQAMDKLMPYITNWMNEELMLPEEIDPTGLKKYGEKKPSGYELHIMLGRPLTMIEEQMNIMASTMTGAGVSTIYHPYVSDMAEFLKGFDLVISAGGTTLKEVCAVGVPCVSFALGDDQVINAIGMKDAGLIPYIGDLRECEYQKHVANVLHLTITPEYKDAVSRKMRESIDGKGALRIARALVN